MAIRIVDRAAAMGLQVDMLGRCCAATPPRYRFSLAGQTITGWLTPEFARVWLDGAAAGKEAMKWQTGDMISHRVQN